ncbi:EscU/YscU/HrcU family type III secretion system export apparatus switch protein [Peribacillus sp. SCS-155]|uniref:EscU/YscU/HrcU family type III secretion system export apparatus switch protein n=1 Tax=Peribacillus sedimenti TaxID=3115297 RepID=UPI0039069862
MKDQKRLEAVALRYENDADDAPTIIAKGKGKVAENILASAAEHNIPVQQDPTLTELLGKLDINKAIPEELYQAVAEVFAFIYKIDKTIKDHPKKE